MNTKITRRIATALSVAAIATAVAVTGPSSDASASSTWVDPNVFLFQEPMATNVDLTTPQNIPLDAAGIGGNRIRRLPLNGRGDIERQIEQDITTAINYERQMRGLYPYTFSDNISAIHSRFAWWLGTVNPDNGCPPGYGNTPTCHAVAPNWKGDDWISRTLPDLLSPISGTASGGPVPTTPANIVTGAKTSGTYQHRASLMVYLGANPAAGEPIYMGIGIKCLPNGRTHSEFVVYRTSAATVNVHPDANLLPGNAGFAPFAPQNFGRRCPQPSAPVFATGGPTSLSVRVEPTFGSTDIRSQCQFELPGPVIQAPFQTWKAHARIVGPGVDQTHTWDWFEQTSDDWPARTHTVTGLPAGAYQVTVWQSNACETSMTATSSVAVLPPATTTTTTTTPTTVPPTTPPVTVPPTTTPTTTPTTDAIAGSAERLVHVPSGGAVPLQRHPLRGRCDTGRFYSCVHTPQRPGRCDGGDRERDRCEPGDRRLYHCVPVRPAVRGLERELRCSAHRAQPGDRRYHQRSGMRVRPGAHRCRHRRCWLVASRRWRLNADPDHTESSGRHPQR
jgi:hypothetical protein